MSKFKNGDGFHIRVNLYIIRFLFCHMDSKNNPNLSKEVKKRRPAYLLYSEDYFPVRQRMDRINKGENFEFSNKEAEGLSKLFAIDKSHFTNKSSEPFPIQGITVTDWACLYKCEYEVQDVRIENLSDVEIKKAHDRVNTALKGIVKSWERLNYKNPLRHICYYFYYGTVFVDKAKSTDTLRSLLNSIPYSDWDKESMDYLKSTHKLLQNHLSYIHCKLELHRLKMEKDVKSPSKPK